MIKLFLLSAFLFAGSVVAGEAVKLPPPRTSGGKPVLEAVAARASAPGNSFPSGEISREELSTILWAASGLNRQNRWTVPFGMGVEPYVDVYAAEKSGVSLYSWSDNSLKTVSGEDVRSRISGQPFANNAPCILIFVTNRASLARNGRMREHWAKWAYAATGAMTQQIYLAADSLGIAGRYVEGMNVDFVRKLLSIPVDEEPVCIFPIGKR